MKVQKRVKKQASEKLTDANISRVIELLENSEKPISKKEACEILNISYNTTRLNTILSNWKEDQENTAKRKKERRGKPAQPEEIRNIAESLLEGDNVAAISKRIYRSPAFVKNVVARIGIPEKITGDDKHKIAMLPEECVGEEFAIGEIAWSAKYHAPCRVEKEMTEPVYTERYGSKCYRVYITEKMESTATYFPSVEFGGFFAYVPGYDLGKLKHLEQYGVSFKYI
jgi:hypothetical protein